MPSNEMKKAPSTELVIDVRVVESMVVRGDLSGLNPQQRAAHYIRVCERLGLDPYSQPFEYLKLNGKEVMYAKKGATDQLAAIHRLNRRIVDGPKVIDLAGTKLVYAVAEATLPNGRVETSTATVPLVDPVNVLMKCETKAKRRVTLSILGLGMLDEGELDTIPANVQEPGGGVVLPSRNEPAANASTSTEPIPEHLEHIYRRIGEIELPGEAVAVWMKYRTDLASLPVPEREAVWQALCRRTEEVGKMKNAKVWLKKAIAEEDARRGSPSGDGPVGPLIADAEIEEEPEEGPSSRAFAAYLEALPKASSLAEVHTAYNGLIDGLHEEGADVEYWTQGPDGAGSMAYARMNGLGHRLASAERSQLLLSRPLAEIIDTQTGIEPGPAALAKAVAWWFGHRAEVKALEEQAHRSTPYMALVRRYSASTDAPSTKKAREALDAAVKAADKGPTPDGTNGGGRPSNGAQNASGATAETSTSPSSPRAMLEQYSAHLASIPDRGEDRGAARVAGGFWKRREDFNDAGVRAEALGLVVDELERRGVAEPHTWLTEIGEKNGYVTRTRKAA
jgi:hypothetical protein